MQEATYLPSAHETTLSRALNNSADHLTTIPVM
jgi:hypothetical protein